jgi:UDPglucose 6-dehydrogenase
MKVTVIGVGYVGLVSGVCLADVGHQVACVDKDVDKIALLNNGETPIFEPNLKELIKTNLAAGRVAFTTSLAEAVSGAEVILFAVGTPPRPDNGHADLNYLFAAVREVIPHISPSTILITKSTVPVGTGDLIEALIAEESPGFSPSVVSNPEFLREGSAVLDFQFPDRIIIGANDAHGQAVTEALYAPFRDKNDVIMSTDRRTAEMTKYAANAFLATKIAFINEVSNLCEAMGANVLDVAHGLGLDDRIGPKYLAAGPGYGGSCLPKDTLALVKTAETVGVDMSIVRTVVQSNIARKQALGQRIVSSLSGGGAKRIAVLGLVFKPGTDDMRDSPSIDIIETLQASGHEVVGYDPIGQAEAEKLLSGVRYASDAYAACEGADAAVIITEWDEFRSLDLSRIAKGMRHPTLFDFRNCIAPIAAVEAGLNYHSIGRPTPVVLPN